MGDNITVIDRPTVVQVKQASVGGIAASLAAHLAMAIDSHDASAISYAPAGTIAALNVQAAIQEIETEYLAAFAAANASVAAHLADGVDSHDALSISFD